MRLPLRLHPDSPRSGATRIEVAVARPHSAALALHYFVAGKMSDLLLPPASAPSRADALWRHTCFEAFVRAPPGAAYTEFNFAPSTQWAAYHFTGYREGMSVAGEIGAPRIEMQSNAEGCDLRVSLALDGLSNLPRDAPWRLGLSAVIEDASGAKSYWALAHPPGKPDFHHADGFACELP